MIRDDLTQILGEELRFLAIKTRERLNLTQKEMSEILGKETIDLYNTSETRSNQKSYGLNYQKLGKQLKPFSKSI